MMAARVGQSASVMTSAQDTGVNVSAIDWGALARWAGLKSMSQAATTKEIEKQDTLNITLKMNMMAKQFALNRRAPKNNLISVAALLFASLMCAQAGPDRHWEADIKGDAAQLMRVTLDLAKNAKSEWIASMGLPSANRTGLVIKDVVINGNSVKFVALELMSARFDLTLGQDGNLKGTISGPTRSRSNSSARARPRWN